MKNPEEIVKCACGLTMRQKNWSAHWQSCRGCRDGSEVDACSVNR